jgi:hypothetical protein
MKTINDQIDIYSTLNKAQTAFNKSKVPCQLLEAKLGKITSYFIDRSKTAIVDWPNNYTLISEK